MDSVSPPAPPPSRATDRLHLTRAAGLVSALTLLSRLLGLVREQVFAALLGAGFFADAYLMAYRIPNLLRDLFAEGALSAAFVPTFTDYLTNRTRAAAYQLANRVMTVLATLLSLLVAAGFLFTGPLVARLAPGFLAVPGKTELTVLLTRIMLPFLPLVSFAAVAMGMLNSEERFGAPALAPSMFNVVTILGGLAFWLAGMPPVHVVIGWSIAVLLGGAAQYLIQVPSLHRSGWRFRPDLTVRDEGMRRIGRLMAPATVGLAAVQVNIFINSGFASQQNAAVSWINYAFRLLYLPIGIFGVTIGTIAGAGLARRAAEKDLEGMKHMLRQSLRLVAFLTVPSTMGLMVLGRPIIRLIYEHGRFRASDTVATAEALVYYSIGLFAYSAIKVLAPAFYALERPKVPLLGSFSSVATNLVCSFTLFPVLGYRALALGTSAGAIMNFGMLMIQFQRQVGGLRGGGMARAFAKIVAITAVMGPAAWGSAHLLEQVLGVRGHAAKLAVGVIPVVIGAVVYVGLLHLIRLEEVDQVMTLVRRKLSRGSAA